MSIPESCVEVLTRDLQEGWSFLRSDGGQFAILSLAALRSLLYYLFRSPLAEARELGLTLTIVFVIVTCIAVSQTRTPLWVTRLATACKQRDFPVAINDQPQAFSHVHRFAGRRIGN